MSCNFKRSATLLGGYCCPDSVRKSGLKTRPGYTPASVVGSRFTCKMRISESGPAWTRTRDLFLIRDNSVCHSCSPPFKKCCKPALFLPTSVLCVHRCSGALSSNCRQRLLSPGVRASSKTLLYLLEYKLLESSPNFGSLTVFLWRSKLES